jgi:hypothetical protein
LWPSKSATQTGYVAHFNIACSPRCGAAVVLEYAMLVSSMLESDFVVLNIAFSLNADPNE